MNGLVGYGSSSEDEDGDPPPPETLPHQKPGSQSEDTEAAKVNGASQDECTTSMSEALQASTEPLQGPMVGPAMSDDLTVAAYEEDEHEERPALSERDLLRYLTQPSQPMASLPPETSEPADPAVTAKFKRFLELKSKGVHFNEDLAGKSSFKNPSLFATLLERAGVSSQAQYSSTLPPDIFSLDLFPTWAYKEALLESQQKISAENEAAKKAQSAAGNRTIEFTPAGRSEGSSSRANISSHQVKHKRG